MPARLRRSIASGRASRRHPPRRRRRLVDLARQPLRGPQGRRGPRRDARRGDRAESDDREAGRAPPAAGATRHGRAGLVGEGETAHDVAALPGPVPRLDGPAPRVRSVRRVANPLAADPSGVDAKRHRRDETPGYSSSAISVATAIKRSLRWASSRRRTASTVRTAMPGDRRAPSDSRRIPSQSPVSVPPHGAWPAVLREHPGDRPDGRRSARPLWSDPCPHASDSSFSLSTRPSTR